MFIEWLIINMLIPLAFGAIGGLVGRTQSTAVQGTLTCNGRPLKNVLVKLYDNDRGIGFDDFMGETTSDEKGFFYVSGSNAEISDIDPKFNIYHDCNDWYWPCQRKISIMIPDDYITVGDVPKKTYNSGIIELAGEFSGETRDCIH
ncbi:unnamed protein product [Dracunculus medinensis]|uniref:Transthyretin-like family protein n=1 Tax=Dracunculus medinensis TaxID=318479 RepID=A0A0N4UAB5_DRAME|nr:unnamed protein product [Dracunculus medinensis]